MMPRYWIKYLGGKSKVEDLVGFAPSNYGTNLGEASSEDSTAEDWGIEGAEPTDNPCYSCDQQGAMFERTWAGAGSEVPIELLLEDGSPASGEEGDEVKL